MWENAMEINGQLRSQGKFELSDENPNAFVATVWQATGINCHFSAVTGLD